MAVKRATTGSSSRTRPARQSPEAAPSMHGRKLLVARGTWLLLAIAALAFFIAAIPPRYEQLLHNTGASQVEPALRAATLRVLGASAPGYAAYTLALDLLLAAGFIGVGVLMFWRKSNEWPPLLFSHLLIMGGITSTTMLGALEVAQPDLSLIISGLQIYGIFGFFLFAYLFPDGHFVPRWIVLPGLVWLVVNVGEDLLHSPALNVNTWPQIVNIPLLLLVTGSLPFAQIYRYRRASNLIQRQQTKWVMFGFTTAIIVNITFNMLDRSLEIVREPGTIAVYFRLISEHVNTLAFLLIPMTIGIAVLRYRLWDIDPVINRTLLYGALTLSVVVVYAGTVSALSIWLQTSGNMAISLVATCVVVVLFQPLERRLQHMIDRVMYGDRDAPYRVLSRLGQQLEATLAPEAVFPTIVATVKDALRLPYVAIALDNEGMCVTAAAAGQPVVDPLVLPLQHKGEVIGQLILGPRAPGDSFSAADRRLLNDLVRQIGAAAYTQRLTIDLQRSRERLVTAREEERLRLRRDLHDGLGPALAAQTLKVGAARALYGRNPAVADKLLAELETDIDAALHEVRRLVYNLRPPALDELGLIGAIREGLARDFDVGSNAQGLHVTLDVPEYMPMLPAAVEVAAYRIVQEALANVARHAHAHHCIIRLMLEQDVTQAPDSEQGPQKLMLVLEVRDDGMGLLASHTAGVGLFSMRERAAELGGSCVIAAQPDGGTVVRAQLPIAVPERE